MGLYDDDKAAITNGDVQDVIYFQTRFAFMKLEAALKSRQPEAAIKGLIPSVINGANDVLKEYPNHADVKAWKAKAEQIQSKIDPNAPPADFKGDYAHWKDYSYEAGWRSYHIAKMAAAAQDWSVVKMHASEAVTQLGRSADRMATWPEDVKAWVTSARAESEKMLADAKSK